MVSLAKNVHEFEVAARIIPRVEQAHGRDEGNPCSLLPIKAVQQEDWLLRNRFNPPPAGVPAYAASVRETDSHKTVFI